MNTLERDDISEVRRPGVIRILEELRSQHPGRSDRRLASEAKLEWQRRNAEPRA